MKSNCVHIPSVCISNRKGALSHTVHGNENNISPNYHDKNQRKILFYMLPLKIRPFYPRGINARKSLGKPRVLHDCDTPLVEWPYSQWQPIKESNNIGH